MSILAAVIIAGLVTVGIHALNRGKAPQLPFPDIRFVDASRQRHLRLNTPDRLPLLLLRLLLIAVVGGWLMSELSPGQRLPPSVNAIDEPAFLTLSDSAAAGAIENSWRQGTTTAPPVLADRIDLSPAPPGSDLLVEIESGLGPTLRTALQTALTAISNSAGLPVRLCQGCDTPDLIVTDSGPGAVTNPVARLVFGGDSELVPVMTGPATWTWNPAATERPEFAYDLYRFLEMVRERRTQPPVAMAADPWRPAWPLLILLIWLGERFLARRVDHAIAD